MQLTRFTDLGLRVLMYLTQRDPMVPVTIPGIAERFGISRNHLVKVVHAMGQQGWLVTTRGKGGGIALARPAAEYRIGEVIRSLEATGSLIDCATPPCLLMPGCRLKSALDEGLEAFYRSLNGYTLADLVAERTGEAIIRLHRGRPADAP
ncbi:Rrf2 family transcriptional regulator [Paludibacterium paludis]|uniref:DNA-binding protein n=1 Tax=Paludibacterium paludis TaxID=1225769 RepID=A0A918P6W9_9NEIS|nr:Rrf2 family transcriptional regulator [Paludibacterium paludis]GGY28308.1 DNA-binding protein [Paludibacterium paludis]